MENEDKTDQSTSKTKGTSQIKLYHKNESASEGSALVKKETCNYFHCPFSGAVRVLHKEDSDSPSRPSLYDDISDVMDDSLDDSELDDVMPQVAEAKVQPSNRDDTASSCSDSDQAGTTSMEKDSSADLETKPDPQASRASPREKSVTVHSRRLTSSSVQPVQITAELLAEHFHESLEVAASKIGIGKSTMKIVCRRLGIEKWPYVHTGSRRRRGRAGQEKAKKGESEGEVGGVKKNEQGKGL
ncbi:hypothetical protein GUITHDRAFT_104240 [Guillardia theta CCMP2712]|uniref:RWP-RK domain-containing protein n=1 Tax=Guillardia theta (strain CCMP2712) TaxID=905079 RepID=L1JNK5_GUITC|nr:hypothetical protein GUITHDRAFT_104240 [Guillardia theta CCMP2712]EKX49844.1 hypothetical protein GUITHDRAFT_104240 [Guillardia theta CCMP2712]|eukprot:XP_005836824.1 hypothetical protein GUITHDRAFT_104240 [Guillardia theta CCMP2712]